jgi:hypothetical protein
MTPLYTAVKRFDAADDDWPSYIAWSGLCQLRELVSLDSMLCPTWFRTLTEDDWRYNVKADFKLELFFDLDHVLARVAAAVRVNVLAVLEEPAEDEVRAFVDPRFGFRGFDLVEPRTGTSALVNSGGFPRAFSGAELSEHGLIVDLARAFEVRDRLRAEYRDDPHFGCACWAIWLLGD